MTDDDVWLDLHVTNGIAFALVLLASAGLINGMVALIELWRAMP